MMNPSRALRTTLAVSLALNAFLAAFVVAPLAIPALASRATATPPWRQAARVLDPDHRARLIALLRADGRRLRPQTQQARNLRRGVWASFAAATFDPGVAKATLGQVRVLNGQVRAAVEDDIVDFAAALPPDQRAAFGQALYRLTPPPAVRRPEVSPPTPAPASPTPSSSPARRSPA